jgi:subtilisin family serine protease
VAAEDSKEPIIFDDLQDDNYVPIPYPRVKLPLGLDKANINLKPAMVWGVADYVSNVTMLRQQLGLTGKGIKIGFIDSGIDYTHKAFGSCTAVNKPLGRCRVVAGYDFVGNDFNHPTDVPLRKRDPVRLLHVCHYQCSNP